MATKTKAIKADVTAGDIRRGKRGDISTCAVALGTRRAVKAAKCGLTFGGYSGSDTVWLETADAHAVYAVVPKKCAQFAKKFDDPAVPKSALKPFSFTLRIPT